jgi:hypothetical protein
MKHIKTVGILTTLGTGVLLAAARPGWAAPSADEPIERSGVIDAWHVLANGQVSLRLTGGANQEAFTTWFTTPGDKTETTRFEHQVLHTVISFATSREPLTVTYGKVENSEKAGKTIKDAIPLDAIMWNVKPSEEKKPATPTRK